MKIKRKIEELDIMMGLSWKERQLVVEEYKKGYHFLLFYGRIIAILLAVFLGHFMGNRIGGLNWFQCLMLYTAVGYLFSLIIDAVEINFFSERVLSDLIKKYKGQSRAD